METIRNWLLPAALAVAQGALLLWPGAPLAGGRPPDAAELAAVLTAVALETAALGRRRREPVLALAGVLAASLLGLLAAPDQYADVGSTVALFSVAARCRVRIAAGATAAVVGVDWFAGAVHPDPGSVFAADAVITALLYVVCAGLGEARRQWLAARRAAARRLAGAEDAGRNAADTERRRLARELHDVSAHHLTSVVVTVNAARTLADSRPELAAEALAFAGATGRETLDAIRQLVAVMGEPEPRDAPPMSPRIEELVAGFGRLGRPIATDLPGDLAGPAAEAVFGIVREALTNALRYAPGAPVQVAVRRDAGALELAVDNAAPRGSAGQDRDAAGLGSGRGVAGMRERAAAVGGELTAGPGPAGGWRVRATLPDADGPRPPAERPRRRDFLREQRLADAALTLTATLLPMMFVLVAVEEGTDFGGAATVVGMSLLMAVHALPLLWRRRAPRAALSAVAATAWLWPAAVVGGVLPPSLSEYLAAGGFAETMAVYALAVYGRGARRTWAWVLAAGCALVGALTLGAAADGALLGGPPSPLAALGAALVLVLLVSPFLTTAWSAGLLVRAHRLRVLAREDHAVTDAVRRAAAEAEAERRRLAAGLHQAVLQRTALMVESADQGRLDEVGDRSRSALAAMRELLRGLGDAGPAERDHTPQPTAADLDDLCRTLRAAGRDVTLRAAPDAVTGLPVPVALSAYRLAEAALGAGDRGPARVVLRRRRDGLHLTVTGVRMAVAGPVAERLRAQAAAARGRVTVGRAGTVRVLLPTGPYPVPVPEVSPSPYV